MPLTSWCRPTKAGPSAASPGCRRFRSTHAKTAIVNPRGAMSMGEERSGSGRPIYRHEQSAPGGLSAGDPALVAAIEGHITKHFGEPTTAWHERVSPYVHIDVHIVEPRDDRPVFTLVTSGMSEKPMRANGEELYSELTMILPPSWPKPDTPGFRTPAGHWPYKLLNDLARLPHAFDTFLWAGHTVPNGDPPER